MATKTAAECPQTDVFARNCPSRSAWENVTGKWASLALMALSDGELRFGELRRKIDGVSEKMLSQTLQTLERDGLLDRKVLTAIPPHVEYALTPLGAAIAVRLRPLADLLESAASDIVAARESHTAARA